SQPMTFSADRMIRCSLPLSFAVEAANQMVIDEVRIDSMMAVTITFCGMLNFFSCRRKNILCWAFLIVEVMFSAHLRSCAIIVPRNLKDSTVLTGESHMMKGMIGAGLLLKSATISTVLQAFSSR